MSAQHYTVQSVSYPASEHGQATVWLRKVGEYGGASIPVPTSTQFVMAYAYADADADAYAYAYAYAYADADAADADAQMGHETALMTDAVKDFGRAVVSQFLLDECFTTIEQALDCHEGDYELLWGALNEYARQHADDNSALGVGA